MQPLPTNRPVMLIITDSLGFPRSEPEFVRYEETYIARLRAAFPEFEIVHYGHGGATIESLYKFTQYYHRTLRPALCFIQSGIVDCAPRALTEIELQVIKRIPLLGKWIGRIVQRNAIAIRKIRKLYYTPLAKYTEFVDAFERVFSPIYWIAIPKPLPGYEKSLPGITDQVEQYNAVLMSRRHVSTENFSQEDMMSDYHHLSVAGHEKLFSSIEDVVRNFGLSGR